MNCFEIKPKKNYGFIYMYTSPSGKNYIGQTSRSLKERAGTDGKAYTNCSIFFCAIQKYGFENFSFQILQEVPLTMIDEREKFFIEFYNTLQPNGYNIQKGGKDNYNAQKKRKTPVIQYNLQGEFVHFFDSVTAAAEEAGCHYQAISQVLSRKRSHYKNYIYRYVGEESPEPVCGVKTHGKEVGQFDMEGNFIQSFKSANEAARAIGKNSNAGRNIRSVCSGKRLSAYGFKWKCLE